LYDFTKLVIHLENGNPGSIHYTTVACILAAASLQPHRSRYWKTATIDEQFIQRAAKILWCYEQGEWLSQRGEMVICLDEKPNIQALSRIAPKQLMGPGRIERREFEYKRHGTTTFLVSLDVLDGTMWGCCLARNDLSEWSQSRVFASHCWGHGENRAGLQ